jgi:hypothetical protein
LGVLRRLREGNWVAIPVGVLFVVAVATALPWPVRVLVGVVLGLALRAGIQWEAHPQRHAGAQSRAHMAGAWLLVVVGVLGVVAAVLVLPAWITAALLLCGGIACLALGVRDMRRART